MTEPAGMRWVSWSRQDGRIGSYSSRPARVGGSVTMAVSPPPRPRPDCRPFSPQPSRADAPASPGRSARRRLGRCATSAPRRALAAGGALASRKGRLKIIPVGWVLPAPSALQTMSTRPRTVRSGWRCRTWLTNWLLLRHRRAPDRNGCNGHVRAPRRIAPNRSANRTSRLDSGRPILGPTTGQASAASAGPPSGARRSMPGPGLNTCGTSWMRRIS